MSFKVTEIMNFNGTPYSFTQDCAGMVTLLDKEPVAGDATAYEIAVAIDFSAVTGLMIVSTQDITLKTNIEATPDDTLVLLANEPVMWHDTSLHDNPLTADVTKVFVTCVTAVAGTLTIGVAQDATP